MDVTQVLFMNRGEGESSYAVNSKFTQKVTSITKPILEREVQSLFSKENFPYKVLNVADLGCSSGPNTFSVISTVVESLEKKCLQLKREMPEIQFYLNDLPGNDFNTLFMGLSRFLQIKKGVSCFVMGTPGSFHGRLFPRNSMHLVHSSYSVHWLTQVPRLKTEEGLPLNKGKIYISKTSPPSVREIYLAQFQQDFTAFLKSRSQEMAPEGRIVLVLHGRRSAAPTCKESCYAWELIAEAISDMVSQGLIDEEKLDLFDVPYYTASVEEIQDVVEREGSFTAEQMEAIPVDAADPEDMADNWSKGVKMAKNIRSFTVSMISHHFGEEILDKLYDRFTQIVVEDFPKESRKVISIILVLVRKEES